MMRTMKKIILLAFVGIVAFGSWHLWYVRALQPVASHDTARMVVVIPRGSSTADIAAILEEKGLIRSASAFKRFVKRSGKAETLQAGSFSLMRSMDAEAILNALTGGPSEEAVITIPEGYTVKDIDHLLSEKGLIKEGDVLACASECDFSSYAFLPKTVGAQRGGRMEGYLFPDTYFVIADGFQAEAFLKRLLDTFQARVVEALAPDLKQSQRSVHEIVTMASLLEEETRTAEERPVVAGILWKRFDEGVGLYVDAAIRYILGKPTGALTAADLSIDSPYNLRKYRGLPPGPIANPGMESIRASLHPEESDYYYYLHGSDGAIHYAVTNDEHNSNKARYLQ